MCGLDCQPCLYRQRLAERRIPPGRISIGFSSLPLIQHWYRVWSLSTGIPVYRKHGYVKGADVFEVRWNDNYFNDHLQYPFLCSDCLHTHTAMWHACSPSATDTLVSTPYVSKPYIQFHLLNCKPHKSISIIVSSCTGSQEDNVRLYAGSSLPHQN